MCNDIDTGWVRMMVLAVLPFLVAAVQAGDFVCATNADGTLCVTQHSGPAGEVVVPAEIDGRTVTRIGPTAFRACTGLRAVRIPDSVTGIDDGAGGWNPSGTFAGCTSLTQVTFGAGLTNIGDYAFFACSGLKTLRVPDSVVRIGIGAFANCSALESVSLGDSVAQIGRSAFEMGFQGYWYGYASSLRNLELGRSLTSIGPWAFQGCTALQGVSIPDRVQQLGHGAFRRCSGLTRATLGTGVVELGRYVFSQCTSLKEVRFTSSAPTCGRQPFFGVPEVRVYRPGNTTGWESVFAGCPVVVDGE